MKHKCLIEITYNFIEKQSYINKIFFDGLIRILKPFYLKDWLLLQIITLGPGLVEGDIYEIKVKVNSFAKVILINQSATKVLTSSKGIGVKQNLDFTIEEHGELEYYPGLLIPFPKSIFSQNITVKMKKNSNFGYLEIWAMGRIARNERFLFSKLINKISIDMDFPLYRSCNIFTDQSSKIGIMENYFYLASGFWTREIKKDIFIEEKNCSIAVGKASQKGSFLLGMAKEGFLLFSSLLKIISSLRKDWNLPEIKWAKYSSAF